MDPNADAHGSPARTTRLTRAGHSAATIRVVLVGYGSGTRYYAAPYIEAVSEFSVVAIVTSDPVRAAAATTDFPAARVVAKFDSALDDVDLAVVSTPNATHQRVVERILDHGVNVVVDKPAALTEFEVRAMKEHAVRRGRLLVPYFNRRWDGDVAIITRALLDGDVGEPQTFESSFLRNRPHARPTWTDQLPHDQGGGILHGLGVHAIDQAVAVFGAAEVESATIACRRVPLVPDIARIELRHEGGVRSVVELSDCADRDARTLRLVGSSGFISTTGSDPQEGTLRNGIRPSDNRWRAHLWEHRVVTSASFDPGPERLVTAVSFWSALARFLQSGAPPPTRIDEATAVARLIDTAVAIGLATGGSSR